MDSYNFVFEFNGRRITKEIEAYTLVGAIKLWREHCRDHYNRPGMMCQLKQVFHRPAYRIIPITEVDAVLESQNWTRG
jgi:hypothetical protein